MEPQGYSKFSDAYRAILIDLLENGEKNKATKGEIVEINGLSYSLQDTVDQADCIPFMRKFGRNYMHDIFERLGKIEMLLKQKPTSKNAWLNVISENHSDLPCLGVVQFFIRNEKLDLFAVSRSSDVWNLLPFDAGSLLMLRDKVAKELDVKRGRLIHVLSSAHFYMTDFNNVRQFIDGD